MAKKLKSLLAEIDKKFKESEEVSLGHLCHHSVDLCVHNSMVENPKNDNQLSYNVIHATLPKPRLTNSLFPQGIQIIDKLQVKLENSPTQTMKEKFESEMKREIKKLQRLREFFRQNQTNSDIKDKSKLDQGRKMIEKVSGVLRGAADRGAYYRAVYLKLCIGAFFKSMNEKSVYGFLNLLFQCIFCEKKTARD